MGKWRSLGAWGFLAAAILWGCETLDGTKGPKTAPGESKWTYDFLGDRGRREALKAVDAGDWPLEVKERLKTVITASQGPWVPRDVSPARIKKYPLCALVAVHGRQDLLGFSLVDEVVLQGLRGAAWELQKSVPEFGGAEVWRAGQGPRPPMVTGDLLGFYYARSQFNDQVTQEGWPVVYTHIALVILALGEDAVIMHDYRPPPQKGPRPWPVRVEKLSQFLKLYGDMMEPRILLRPSVTPGFLIQPPEEPKEPGEAAEIPAGAQK